MKNKRGQDLSIGTLILIVLGVIVLVLLILGFSIGWSNLWEKINIFGASSSLGDVVTACNLAVNSQNTFDYCQNFRQVRVDGKTQYVNCEDGRIKEQLNSPLSCGNETQVNNLIIAKCATLNSTMRDDGIITINNENYNKSCTKI